jgi:cytoskeleton protein RodZ
MSDETNATPASSAAAPLTAGGLLRQARQAQGLHIAALAAAIKVSQRKLEALEGDRLAELPDATFTRALAQTVCRTLKIDAAPVLALLPPPPGQRLEHVGGGINAPFRDRPGQAPSGDWSMLASPALWAPLVLIVAAAVVYFLPSGWLNLSRVTPAAAPAASSAPVSTVVPASAVVVAPSVASAPPAPVPAPAAAPAASVVVETVHSAPPVTPGAPSTDATASPLTGVLQVRTVGESWIEVLDGRGQTLLSRVVQPGEAVGLDGATPLRITIGNATATQVSFRGKALDLAPYTRRDNVARLDLK